VSRVSASQEHASELPEKPDNPASPDRLLGGRVMLRQPAAGYRAAIDPLLLAAAVPVQGGERVLDLGCGSGAASLCLLARCPRAQVIGLEVQPDMAALAQANARDSALATRFSAICADLLSPPFSKRRDAFDHVMANPPYLPAARGRVSPESGRAAANVEGAAKLADWVAAALALVRPRGSITFIHRADRLDELLALLTGRAGGIEIAPLWPAAGKSAKRVLVRARPGLATPTRLSPGLTLHRSDGGFTEAAERILRDGEALPV
jgi:tRNA1(Val) A37 N6-methylase TrmN6